MADTDSTLAYFPFFAGDWLSSTSVTLMPAEVEGTYIRLLAHQWRHGSLPANPRALVLLTKRTPAQWKREWPMLAPHFPESSSDGLRRNERLEAERIDAHAKYDQRVDAGNRSAAAKAAKRAREVNDRSNETATTVETSAPTKPATNMPTKRQQSESESKTETAKQQLTVVVSETPAQPPPEPRRTDDPPPVAPLYAEQEAELRAACLPHQATALTALMTRHRQPYVVVFELYACATGLNVLRGKHTRNLVTTEHVIAAIWEMAVNDAPWSARLFRAYAMTCADRGVDLSTPEDRALQRVAAEAAKFTPPVPVIGERDASGAIVSREILAETETPEARELRRKNAREAMEKLRADWRKNTADDPRASDEPQSGAA